MSGSAETFEWAGDSRFGAGGVVFRGGLSNRSNSANDGTGVFLAADGRIRKLVGSGDQVDGAGVIDSVFSFEADDDRRGFALIARLEPRVPGSSLGLLYASADSDNLVLIDRVDARGRFGVGGDGAVYWTDRDLFRWSPDDGFSNELRANDLAPDGREYGRLGKLVVDGDTLAFATATGIFTMPVEGGRVSSPATVVARLQPREVGAVSLELIDVADGGATLFHVREDGADRVTTRTVVGDGTSVSSVFPETFAPEKIARGGQLAGWLEVPRGSFNRWLVLGGNIIFTDRSGKCPLTGPCAGDCNGDRSVAVNELVLSARIALRESTVSRCTAADRNVDSMVSVSELLAAVRSSLDGCG